MNMNEMPQNLIKQIKPTKTESSVENKDLYYNTTIEQIKNLKEIIENKILNLPQEELVADIYDNTDKYTETVEKLMSFSVKVFNDSLLQSNNEMTEILCHDIKTCMTSVYGYTEMLQEEKNYENPEYLKKYILTIIESLEFSIKLSEELIEHLNIKLNKLEINLSELNLKAELQDIINDYDDIAKLKNIKLKNNISDINIISDKSIIQAAIRNFITNAIKFTPEGGEITMSVEEINEYIKINVSDTGIGIEERDINRILNLTDHFKLKGLNGEQGSGVALKIIKQMLEKIGGQIEIESEINKGSTFSVRIPNKK